ncbi:MAG: radical SAM protein [Dehalococcoidia bacterium]
MKEVEPRTVSAHASAMKAQHHPADLDRASTGSAAARSITEEGAAHRPLIVSWNITGACHLRCGHCYLDARGRWPDELTTEEGLALIDEMAEAGTELLILTGGEPLLRPDLPVLARHAADAGIGVVLGTTGMQIDRPKARLLRESGVAAAGISIDSIDPARHDEFRGVPGAWQRAVAGMEACREEGLEVLVHTTALQMNVEEIPALIAFAHERGARAFHLFFLVCTGRGERLTDLAPAQYEVLLSQLLDAQETYPNMMVRARCAPYIGRMAAQRGLPPVSNAGCLAGTSYCRVTPVGEVTACPYLPDSAGNVRARSFTKIWESAPSLTRFRAQPLQLGGKCGACAFSQGPEPICVGCRARALALQDDAMAADPWCLHEPSTERDTQAAGTADGRETGEPAAVPWTREAEDRLERIPFFIRGRVRRSAEAHVRQRGLARVTPEVLAYLRERVSGRHGRSE